MVASSKEQGTGDMARSPRLSRSTDVPDRHGPFLPSALAVVAIAATALIAFLISINQGPTSGGGSHVTESSVPSAAHHLFDFTLVCEVPPTVWQTGPSSGSPVPMTITLTCANAVAAARAAQAVQGLDIGGVEFRYGAYCPPGQRCLFSSPSTGYVIFHRTDGGQDLWVTLRADEGGVVRLTSEVVPYPNGRAAADSDVPAAGLCLDPQQGDIAAFQLSSDTPQPRCGKVLASQRLRVVNATSSMITVTYDGIDYALQPGADHTFEAPFGLIWQPGDHDLHTSMYVGGGPEIWLVSK